MANVRHCTTLVLGVLQFYVGSESSSAEDREEVSVTQSKPNPLLEGDDLVLTCIPDVSRTFRGWIEWKSGLQRNSMVSLSEPTFTLADSSLILASITRDQSGWYQCAKYTQWNSKADGTPSLSSVVPVIVHYGPEISDKHRNWVGAKEGNMAILECVVKGNPLPAVTWYGPNDNTLSSYMGRISLELTIRGDSVIGYTICSRLIIPAVVASIDCGTYRCKTTNHIGNSDELRVELKETARCSLKSRLKYCKHVDSKESRNTPSQGLVQGLVGARYVKNGSIPTPIPTKGPASPRTDDTLVFVLITVGSVVLLSIVISCWRYFKRNESNAVQTTSRNLREPPIARTVSVELPNRSFVSTHSADELPPTYDDAVENIEADPPPTYEEQEELEAVTINVAGDSQVQEDGD
ncbi:uncharacterized protein LOC110989832 isoform X2 [Acanthaster planci]|uniref:Uncharacterized protein LOC110989832 isoform X2 n=1 Tax=Acanthaster planci TaxID=133434 RepID=A0A8B7ZZL7_ACAPL|nr:uncharacterized protein LOC110989832 isoform X2 [Acanthaster planci]